MRGDLDMDATQLASATALILADEVRAHLADGDLAAAGPVRLAGGLESHCAALAARVVLADVEHCVEQEDGLGRPVGINRWWELVLQLRAPDRLLNGHGPGEGRRGG